MNDLNGRLDEIRRRSEALKEKQRKRQKLLLTILPLCLCLVLGLSLLPGLSPSAKDSVDPGYWPERGEPMGPLIPEQSASTTLSVVRIEITGNGLDRTINEPGAIREICKILAPANIGNDAPVGGKGKESTDIKDGVSIVIPGETKAEKEPYTLILTDTEGAVQSFQLQGNALTDLSTEKNRGLTANALNALYQLLGLPMEEGTQAPLPAFLPPPTGYLVTENGKTPLRLGGYTSSLKTGDAISRTFHADQVIRPLPLGNMETVTIRTDAHLDGIYLYADTGASIPMGAKVALDWQEQPDTVQCRFWPADYKETGTRERTLKCEKDGFTACLGDYIYEFSVAWGTNGSDYVGTANYYVRVIVEPEG